MSTPRAPQLGWLLRTLRPGVVAASVLAIASAPALGQTSELALDTEETVQIGPGTATVATLTGAQNAFALLALDVDPGPTLLGGDLVPLGLTPALTLLPFGATNGAGVASWVLPIPADPSFVGAQFYFGGAVADIAAPGGLALSNGASLEVVDVPTTRGVELGGRALNAAPGFTPQVVFQTGQPISVAVDAFRQPYVAGKQVDVYLVEARSAAEWASSAVLVDASSDGPETFRPRTTRFSSNHIVIEPGALPGSTGEELGAAYDVVVDTNRNGLLDDGDLIDGLGDEVGLYIVPEIGAPGPYAVTSTLYNGPTQWLRSKVYWPSNIASLSNLPFVQISHGNGHNYQWYDHLGEHLASWGFVVSSHRNNTVPGVQSAATTIIDNLDHFFGSLAAISPALVGKVDNTRIGMIGHSRGGEGVSIAYHRLFVGTVTPANYDISGIKIVSAIAPTYFEGSSSTPDTIHDGSYHLWVGGADADVNGCTSSAAPAVMGHYGWALGERSMINVQGAGHGAFHDGGGSTVSSGPCLLSRTDVHSIMRPHALALFSHYLKDDPAAEEFLWREWTDLRPLGVTSSSCAVVTVVHTSNDASTSLIVDDFESQGSLFVASSGAAVDFTVGNVSEGELTDNDNFTQSIGSEPFNAFTHGRGGEPTNGAVFSFGGGASQYFRYEIPIGMRDVSAYDQIAFMLAQQSRDTNTVSLGDELRFSLRLIDGNGRGKTLGVDGYGDGIGQPYQRGGCGTGTGWASEFESFRLPLVDFLRDDTLIDLTDVQYITFLFGSANGSASGRVAIDQVEFTLR
ncbi:hypothetical protein Pla163_27500 [Planctomycetes bacterium Pla163]|uniref:PET hydrolase/cutinase-like domain-containing protein n=1 Tax=Rohdeia mirabilis TaxID=2528008 RepID=A0A518D2B2_9BACT|nr:hypothetical protein Pla163_27500 [Planctomycetes bacterium Pla163]